MNFPLSLVVNVAVETPQAGVGNPNTSNVAIFTRENYQPSFGDLAFKIYPSGSAGVITDFGSGSVTAQMAVNIFGQKKTIRQGSNGGGYLVVIPFLDDAETLEAAIVRTQGLVQYFGVLAAEITVDADLTSACAYIQGQNLFAVFPGVVRGDLTPSTGRLAKIIAGGYTNSEPVYYDSGVELDGILLSAAYISLLMSVDFTGSKTAQTMNLKTLVGPVADATIDDTTRLAAKTIGAATYISFGTSGIGGSSVAKVQISTANGGKVDDRYALVSLGAYVQVNYFNALAETDTKIPQTEEGMDVLKDAIDAVLDQYVTAGVGAPGKWTSPDMFGDEADLLRNISDLGYYTYTAPLALQDQADREAGNAPLAQSAFKLAGAVLGGNVLIQVNP